MNNMQINAQHFTDIIIHELRDALAVRKMEVDERARSLNTIYEKIALLHLRIQGGEQVRLDSIQTLQALSLRIEYEYSSSTIDKLHSIARVAFDHNTILEEDIRRIRETALPTQEQVASQAAQPVSAAEMERLAEQLRLDPSVEAQKIAQLLSLMSQYREATSSQQAMRDLAQLEGFALRAPPMLSIAELEAQIRQLTYELRPSLMATKDIAGSYGNKYANLLHMAHLVDTLGIDEVTIPEPKGLATKQVESLLRQHAPAVIEAWEELGKMYAVHTDPSILFLQTPEAKAKLAIIREGIQAVFDRAGKEEIPYSSLEMSPEVAQWMEKLRQEGETLMVRSSGAEDSRVMANAGGNASIACVEPSRAPWLHAVGQVVSSYFTTDSLQNRLNAKTNPFAEPLQLAVATQQFIGESEESPEIPVSFVVFSNEPLYIGGEKFRLMRICATYGQGEGVVGGHAIANDTFYLLQSEAHPHQLIQWGGIQKKLSRVAPVVQHGKLSLGIKPNPSELIDRPSLSEKQLQAIYRQAVLMESFFGDKATDIEGVCKGGKIHFVQARPVIREGLVPTYVDVEKLERGALDFPKIESTILVPGKASVLQISSSSQVLIRDTIEDAEKGYNRDRNELVLVYNQPGENSHPMVNFATMGASCLYVPKEKEETVNQLMAKVDATHQLIVDMQTGALFLWDIERAKADEFVTRGFAVHPAQPMISLPGAPLPLGLMQPAPQELRNLVRQLQTQATQKIALQRLRDHPHIRGVREKQTALQQSITVLRAKGQPVPVGALQILQTLDTLDRTVQRAFQELEQVPQPEEGGTLRRLWHVKVLTTLVTGAAPRPGMVGQYTVLDAVPLAQAGKELVDYQSRLPHAAHLIDLLMDGELAPNPKLYEEWRDFLLALEPLVESGAIAKEQIDQFKRQLSALRESGALPLWLTFFFAVQTSQISDPMVTGIRAVSRWLRAPDLIHRFSSLAASTENMRMALNVHADQRVLRKRLETYLGQISQEQLEQIKTLQQRRQKLDEIRMQLDAFGKPESFTQSWNALKAEIESFWCSEERMKTLVRSSSPLVRMIASQTMVEAVTLLDDAVKAAKQSASFPNDATKVARFKSMLEPYFHMMRTWSTLVTPGTIPTHDEWPIPKYIIGMRRIFSELSDSDPGMLFASRDFSVNAAVLGTKTLFGRHHPRTWEDFLTLIHQNCLVFVNSLNMELLIPETVAKAALPDLLKSAVSTMESYRGFIRPQRIGIRTTAAQVIISYNVPLHNHSGQIDLIYDKSTDRLSLRGHLLGDARERWPFIAKWVQVMQNSGLFIPDQLLRQGEQDITFVWRIPDTEKLAWALQEYDAMARYSLHDRRAITELPERWIPRGSARAVELGIQCFKQGFQKEPGIQGFNAVIEDDLLKRLNGLNFGNDELNTLIQLYEDSWIKAFRSPDPIAYIEQSDFSETQKSLMLGVVLRYSLVNVIATAARLVPPSEAFFMIFKLERLGFTDLAHVLAKKKICEGISSKEIQEKARQALVGKPLVAGLLDVAEELFAIGKRENGHALLCVLMQEEFDDSLEPRITKVMDSLYNEELRSFIGSGKEKDFFLRLVQRLLESGANDLFVFRVLKLKEPLVWTAEFQESVARFATRAIYTLPEPYKLFSLLFYDLAQHEVVVEALRMAFGQFKSATRDFRWKAGNIAIQLHWDYLYRARTSGKFDNLIKFHHLIKGLALSDDQNERAFAVCFFWRWVRRSGETTPFIDATVVEMQQSQDASIREDGVRLARLIGERNPEAFKLSEAMFEWE